MNREEEVHRSFHHLHLSFSYTDLHNGTCKFSPHLIAIIELKRNQLVVRNSRSMSVDKFIETIGFYR